MSEPTTTTRIDHAVASGTFSLDGQTYEVDNNVWVVGDDAECVVIDAPHDAAAIIELIGDRRLMAIVCTHAHDDHVRVAPAVADSLDAPILLHPDDRDVWALTHAEPPDSGMRDGQLIVIGDIALRVIHTPGHTPGSVCLYSPDLGVVFTGDTLFKGGPGATGRSFSDHDLIVRSITERLLTLPDDTIVKTGHGDDTTIGAERDNIS